jgi:carboxyl-terminal processing protease
MSEPTSQQSFLSKRFFTATLVFLIFLILLGAAGYIGFLLGQSGSSQVAVEGAAEFETLAATLDHSSQSLSLTATPEAVLPPTITGVPVATATLEVATEALMVEMVKPQDMAAASETSVPTAEPATNSEQSQTAGDEIDLSTFFEVWRLVEDEFDGQIPEDKELLYGAIAGSLNALDDSYTRFIRPEIAERLRDDLDGSVSGIGAIVRPGEDGIVEIVRPLDGQPADQAGLLAGDLIIAVDGQSVGGMSFDEVLLLIRGPEGTTVNLTIVRADMQEPLQFSLVRAEFEVPIVETQIFERDSKTIAYVRLSSFTRSSDKALLDALTMLLDQEPDGLILDLRDNGGGYLDEAVSVADFFLPDGVVLYERSSNGDLDKTFRSVTGDLAEDIPLVVLVNGGSASASEIVAGAVKDNGRGFLVGEPTFGKGSVQHVHTLNDGSELRVTIARWFTPENRSISEEGVLPDLEVVSPEDLGGDDDTQLQMAIEYLLE